MRTAVVVLALLLASTSTRADDKSPGLALGLSVSSTTAGVFLLGVFAGDSEIGPRYVVTSAALAVTGPSWGHLYTGDYDLAVGGTLLRVIGLAMLAEGQGDCTPDPDPFASLDDCVYLDQNKGLMAAGAILFVGTALAEMIDAPLAARRYNREHAVTLTPTVDRDRYGVALVGSF